MDFDCVDGLRSGKVDVMVDVQVDIQVDVALYAHHVKH